MKNPFKPYGPVEVPIVDTGNESNHIMNVISVEMDGLKGEKDSIRQPSDNNSEKLSPDAQDGVLAMEATTIIWTKKHLVVAYFLMWLVTFIDGMQQGASGSLQPYVTSAFRHHSLTAYTNVMSGIIGGVLKLPLAQVLNIFGRPQGFSLSVAALVLGLILMATCSSVHMYAAAQIFYWLGYNGMSYTLGIFIADTSSLKNRGFMFGYVNSPYLITVWIAGPLSERFTKGTTWRLFYIYFVIATIVSSIPLLWLFLWNYRKAQKAGIITPTKTNRQFSESVRYYATEFDAGGLLLLMGGLVFFLLPFSLYSYQKNGWGSPLCISFWTIGILMVVAFVLYEKYIAPKTFIPYHLLMDRTVLGGNVLAGTLFISFYLWNAFFVSFLQVVSGLSLQNATYVSFIYTVGSCLFSVIVGLLIRITGRFKWIALYVGLPVTAIGAGLMIHFRQADQPIGGIILSQMLIACAGGALVITEQIAVMAATDHQHVAVVLALEGMMSSIGGGIGSSIGSTIWTAVFPAKLNEYLPSESRADALNIYANLTRQLEYPKGNVTRLAIERAYSDAQKWMCTASTSILAVGFVAVVLWKDIRVSDFKQTKGRVA